MEIYWFMPKLDEEEKRGLMVVIIAKNEEEAWNLFSEPRSEKVPELKEKFKLYERTKIKEGEIANIEVRKPFLRDAVRFK